LASSSCSSQQESLLCLRHAPVADELTARRGAGGAAAAPSLASAQRRHGQAGSSGRLLPTPMRSSNSPTSSAPPISDQGRLTTRSSTAERPDRSSTPASCCAMPVGPRNRGRRRAEIRVTGEQKSGSSPPPSCATPAVPRLGWPASSNRGRLVRFVGRLAGGDEVVASRGGSRRKSSTAPRQPPASAASPGCPLRPRGCQDPNVDAARDELLPDGVGRGSLR
jgi:hypothetical protein